MTTFAPDQVSNCSTEERGQNGRAPAMPPPAGGAEPGPEMPCHELLAELIPHMPEKHYQDLKEHIAAHGQKEPVVVHAGKILDGRSVYQACRELKREPVTVPWDGRGSELEFIVGRNLHRRHLTSSQRAIIAAKVVRRRQALADTDATEPAADKPRAKLPAGRERDRAAKEQKVSSRAVGDALVVADKGVPALQRAAVADEVKVSAAALVARLPPEEQEELVRQGPEAVKKRAGQLRKTPRDEGQALEPATPDETEKCQVVEIKPRTRPNVLAKKLISALGPERAAQLRDALDQALTKMCEPVAEHMGG